MKDFKNPAIFIVEDEPAYAKLIQSTLNFSGYRNVTIFNSGEEYLEKIDEKHPDIVFQDYDLPGMNGKEVMNKVKAKYPQAEFIFLSGQSSIKVAVETLKNGAFDYIVKDEAAQQNVTQKIKKLLYIKKLEFEKTNLQFGKRLFLTVLILSWIIIGIIYYFKVYGS